MKKTLLILVIMLAASPLAFGQTANRNSKAEREVAKVNEEYDEAIVRRDAGAYERILADDFIFTNFDGEVSNKTQELEKIKSGDLKFEFGRSDDVRIKIYGKTAVVTARFTAKGQSKSKDFTVLERYTAVFVKRKGRWQLVAEQSNETTQK
jgi:ketosteroid isomerase-like protein